MKKAEAFYRFGWVVKYSSEAGPENQLPDFRMAGLAAGLDVPLESTPTASMVGRASIKRLNDVS